MARPTGVTILAVLAAIGGVLGILVGLAAIGIGGFAGGLVGGTAGAAIGAVALIGGLIVLVVSVVELAIAYGFWNLRPWAWQWGIVLAAAQIVLAVLGAVGIFAGGLGGGFFSVVLSAVIIYYLNMPDIRRAFGAPDKGWPFIGG
jgi:hypothetical protein